MRLSRVYIPQYGPLQEDLELDESINVIRGSNESGKSLLVESLLKQLADGPVPNPVIGESPEGFVELVDGGERHKLGDGHSLLTFCRERYGQEIRSDELRNIFVIRSGDLTFHGGDDFYTHITDKLTGRSVRDIDDSFETDFDTQELEEAKRNYNGETDKRKRLEKELENHERRLREFQQRAHTLDFGVFVGERLELEVENLDALEKLVERLNEFISAIENDAEASRVAIEIFDEIQQEEKEKTAELFEGESRATEIFREITDGRYETVTYDNEENQLMVVKSTGETFVPERLSDGTRDQLYLSIRVALGEKMLDDETGFFIMDDAFLTADPQRLETQADVVEKLADEGWQIVYLSSKEDAISALSARSGNDVAELLALQ